MTVSVDVKNTGKRAGDEVVQLYVKHDKIRAGTSGAGTARLQAHRLAARRNEDGGNSPGSQFARLLGHQQKVSVVEPGKLELRIGASSADIRLKKTVTITN